MIHALDHIVLAAASSEAAVSDYEVLLGRRANNPAQSAAAAPSIQLANVRLEFAIATNGTADGLSTLAFTVADTAKARHLLERRALPPTKTGDERVLQIAPEATHGVPLRLVERTPGAASPALSSATREPDAAVAGLDHVVI